MKQEAIYLLWPTTRALFMAATTCMNENDIIDEVIETGQRSLLETLALVEHQKNKIIRVFLPADLDKKKSEIKKHLQKISNNNNQAEWYTVSDDYPPEPINTYLRYKISLAFFGDEKGRVSREQLKDAITSFANNQGAIPTEDSRALQVFSQLNQPAIEGQSAKMIELKQSIRRVARAGLENVLLLGETGSGKEASAFFLHDFDPNRRGKEFQAVNCAGLQEEFLASELFGHVKGAYTGADKKRVGLIAKLDGGTLFLDELPDMPLRIQAMLLRFLENGVYFPMGSNKAASANVKIIAGGQHELLADKIRTKEFRKDLYYRLAGKVIKIPSLREIPEDIPQIIDHLVYRAKSDRESRNETIAYFNDRIAELADYHWPGNIRELANYIKRRLRLGNDENIIFGEDNLITSQQAIICDEQADDKKQPLETEEKFDKEYTVATFFKWRNPNINMAELKESVIFATPKEVATAYTIFVHDNLKRHGCSQAMIAKKLNLALNTLKKSIHPK